MIKEYICFEIKAQQYAERIENWISNFITWTLDLDYKTKGNFSLQIYYFRGVKQHWFSWNVSVWSC
jgi:hypothetical protein